MPTARQQRHLARLYSERRAPARTGRIGALRALVPVVAGSARLSASRFLLADVPSAIAWSVTIASIGFVWGDDIAGVIDRVGIGLSVGAVAALVLFFVVRRRRRAPLGPPNLSGLR